MSEKVVRVYVRGGVIQNMDVPEGVFVEIYDYDVDGVPDNETSETDDGRCLFSVWPAA